MMFRKFLIFAFFAMMVPGMGFALPDNYSAVNIGGSPRGLAMHQSNKCHLYVTVGMGVTVLDVCKNRVVSKFWSLVRTEESLVDPQGISVEGNGSFWVADTGRNSIIKFNKNGEKIKEFNITDNPTDIRVVGDGSIIVVNSERQLIHAKQDGTVISKASVGSLSHEERPGGFNVHSVKFVMNSNGTPVWVDNNLKSWLFPWKAHPETRGWMAGPGQMVCSSTTGGAEISSDGYVYLADGCGITKYDGKGRSIANISLAGSHVGSVWDVQNIISGPNNSLFVADTGNFRIQQLSNSGRVIHVWGADPSLIPYPEKMSVEGDGMIRGYSYKRGISFKFKDNPADIFIPDYWKGCDDLPSAERSFVAGVDDRGAKYYLTKTSTYGQARLIVVDKDGTVINQMSLQNTDAQDDINILAVDKKGAIFIFEKNTYSGKQAIRRFSKNLEELAPIVNSSINPNSMVVDDEGKIFLADSGSCKYVLYGNKISKKQWKEKCTVGGVKILSPTGVLIKSIVRMGKDGKNIYPLSIGKDRHGFIYVSYQDAFYKYSPSGKEIAVIPRRYAAISHGPYYEYIAVDSQDRIYVTDNENDVPLEIYDQNGNFLDSFSRGQVLDELLGYKKPTAEEMAEKIDFSSVFSTPMLSKIYAGSKGSSGYSSSLYVFDTKSDTKNVKPVFVSSSDSSGRLIAAAANDKAFVYQTSQQVCLYRHNKKSVCKNAYDTGLFNILLLIKDDEPFLIGADESAKSLNDFFFKKIKEPKIKKPSSRKHGKEDEKSLEKKRKKEDEKRKKKWEKEEQKQKKKMERELKHPSDKKAPLQCNGFYEDEGCHYFNDAVMGNDGLTYATDAKTKEVVVLKKDGKLVRSWGSGIGTDRHSWMPHGIIKDGNKVFVTDTINHAVQIFDSNGKLLSVIDNNKLGSDNLLVHPTGLAYVKPNILYVSDIATNFIHKVVLAD